MASNGTDGVSRILTKLQKRLENREFYEAHQIYRTLYFRYCAQQKYDEAITLLMNGSLALLNANQMSSGVDLALLMVNTLEKANAPVNSENIGKVIKLHRLIEHDHIERPKYVHSAMRWSKLSCPAATSTSSASASANSSSAPPTSSSSIGNPFLHGEFAVSFWLEKDYTQARYHFIRSQDGEGCAAMLVEYQITCGYSSEVDMFIAQAVLQFLCLQNRMTAEVCFNCYIKQHPQVERGPPFIRPLLNFLWMLLLAVDGGSLTVFTILCEQYELSLRRDPSYHDYLARIGQLFFHVPVPKMNSMGLFGSLLPDLLKCDDEGDEDRLFGEPSPVELD